MEIKFINHASVLVKANKINLISDPWLFGSTFYDGWSLVSKSCNVDWSKIDYVWISHEHPDHFHIPSIKSIPEKYKPNITFLYQSTMDNKVNNWLRAQNFKVQLLHNLKKIKITKDVFIKSGKTPQDDSWLLIDDGKTKFLNLNDCETKSRKFKFIMKKFAKDIGSVDVLASQFGFASYLGYSKTIRKKSAKSVLDKVDYQIEILKPKFYIPFASFSYFSHNENFYQNKENNSIFDVFNFLSKKRTIIPVVMYPGDKWTPNKTHNNKTSLDKYKKDYDKVLKAPLIDTTEKYTLDLLKEKSLVYKEKVLKKNKLLKIFKPAATRIWIKDLNKSIKFDLNEGITIIDLPRKSCDIEMASDLIFGWLNFDYGGASAYISARISYNNNNAYRSAYKYFYISNGNNRGETWPWFVLKRRLKARLIKTFY
mgnify:CR=1 FL=1